MSADLPAVDLASASPFVAATAFEVGEVSGTRVTGTVQVGPEQHTPWGVVHGGLYCAVIESAASIGASVAVADGGQFAVGVNNNTDFLRSVSAGRITATATPIHRGRVGQLWLVVVTDAAGKAIARGQVRLQNVRRPGA